MKALVDSKNVINYEFKRTPKKHASGSTNIQTILAQIVFQDQNYSTDKVESLTVQDLEIVVLANKKAQPWEGVHDMKIDGMCTLKHDIISSKFYEFLVKTQLK